ncbi:MAG: histidine kinase [Bacteroidota bacterium]|nr:histidine kinase [Bacteroidota bacterium]
MKFISSGQATAKQLQWLVWIAVFLIIFFSLLPEDGFYEAAIFTFINVSFYVLIIYGNISFLFPRFYERGQKILYGILAFIFIVTFGLARGFLIETIYNKYVAVKPQPIMISSVINFMVAGFLTYLLSFIFRIAIAYFALKQQSEKILVQKSQAELNLLKSQVQPHFLFNTLNNIYYEAYREAPRTAKLIERLSDIMRYFVDESPKEEVSLATEVQFLENYIALEKIRIRHEIELNFIKDCNADLRIPPMLLMTFVENIFKHGIDKSSSKNKIDMSLTQKDGYLLFETRNQIHEKPGTTGPNGFGIENLRKRLTLLYGSNFELKINNPGNYFTAFLKVPIA